VIVAMLVLIAACPARQDVGEEVRRWINRLGDSSMDVREEAAKKLGEIGEAALPLLRAEVAHKFADAGLRVRAADLIESIEWKAAEKKFEERVRGSDGKGKKWERLVDNKARTWSLKYRLYAEEANEETMPTVAAVARDGTIIEARGIGVVKTFLPLVFGESKPIADDERREVAEACMLVLKRSLPLHSGIKVEPGSGNEADLDEHGRLRVGFMVIYPIWGPMGGWMTLQFGTESRLVGFGTKGWQWQLEQVYEKETERLANRRK
jgi:hypothetical protein